jgi:hypothetical protein
MRGDQQAIADALADIRQSLEVDGYRLGVEGATTHDLRVRITALPGACEECLAPAEVIKMIISGGVGGAYAPDEIELLLPAAGAH